MAEQTKISGMVQSHLVASCQIWRDLLFYSFVPLFISSSNRYVHVKTEMVMVSSYSSPDFPKSLLHSYGHRMTVGKREKQCLLIFLFIWTSGEFYSLLSWNISSLPKSFDIQHRKNCTMLFYTSTRKYGKMC